MTEPRFYGAVRVPSPKTLAKYGMTYEGWSTLLRRQGHVCAICKTVPASGILHIDHHHVRGWKKMAPETRRRYVRGLICQFDNRFVLARNMKAGRLRAAADYLDSAPGDLGPVLAYASRDGRVLLRPEDTLIIRGFPYGAEEAKNLAR